jgi:hypothetical protein
MALFILREHDSRSILREGATQVLRNLATGNIEEEIDELEKDAKDIHTPEQQRLVVTKIARLIEKLVVLRHNPGFVQKTVHDSISWFGRVVGRDDAAKELSTRTSEELRRLATLRDRVLAKKWSDDASNEKLENLKKQAEDLIDGAARQEL